MNMKSTREESAEMTRDTLVEEAGALFSSQGYSQTSLGEIVSKAKVTKGAFYHHFDSKEQLFAACYTRQAQGVAEKVSRVATTNDVWVDLNAQCRMFLGCAAEPGVSIQEAITVLGWEPWRKLDEACTMGLLIQNIERLKAENKLKPFSTNVLVDAIYGLMVNAMMTLANSSQKAQTQDELLQLIQCFLQGLIVDP